MIRKKIKDLVVGDVLQSGYIVKSNPLIEGDKATIVLETDPGVIIEKTYGKETPITVDDKAILPVEDLDGGDDEPIIPEVI